MAISYIGRNHVYETFSASGTVYLTLDDHLIYQYRFQQHIQLKIVYDKEIPVTANDDSECVTLSSDVLSDCSSVCCSKSTPSNYKHPDICVEYTKPDLDGQFVDHSPPFNLDNQTCGDRSNSEVIGTVGSVNDGGPMVYKCHDASVTGSENCGMTVNSVGSNDVLEIVLSKSETSADSEYVGNNQVEAREMSSETLSQLPLVTDRQSPESLQTTFADKIPEMKVQKRKTTLKNSRIQTKHTDQKLAVVKTVIRLKRTSKNTSEKSIKKTDNISNKLKMKQKDTVIRQRVLKVRKLELEKEVKCEYCLQIFKSQQEYFDHRKGDRTSFKCKICSKEMPFKAHLMVHMRKHNNLQDVFLRHEEHETTRVKNCSSGSGDSKSKQTKCDMCGQAVSNIAILKTHMMIHTGEYAYQCCVCGEKTHSIAKHSSHLASHLKSGKVQCKICNIRFETRSDLSRHQLTHEFKCSICDKVFPNKTSRVFHYKVAHKDDILKCEVCGKLFSSEEELAPHLKYHRNRAKTQCTICGLFVTRLDNHILSHNQRSEDTKTYVCDQCPKQFKQKLSFQRHLRTHSEEKPYACMECPKRFARSGGLRRHMITHTQEKPFVCNICGKACSQMGNLRIHMQIHKDCSLIQCSVCGEHFPFKSSLQQHLAVAHYTDMVSQDPTRSTSHVSQHYYL